MFQPARRAAHSLEQQAKLPQPLTFDPPCRAPVNG